MGRDMSTNSCYWLFFAVAALAFGADTGQITGVVKDPDQAVIPGSSVTLTNQQTKVKTTATTDGQGVYTFSALQPSAYVAEVDVKGFKPVASPELKVAA